MRLLSYLWLLLKLLWWQVGTWHQMLKFDRATARLQAAYDAGRLPAGLESRLRGAGRLVGDRFLSAEEYCRACAERRIAGL
jgi:hypothetical protein